MTTTTPTPVYDEDGALIGVSMHNTLHSPAALLALAGRLATAEAWLRRHGQHPPTCGAARGQGCDCGLDEIRRGKNATE